jgi:SAM-dependent methyltransferase
LDIHQHNRESWNKNVAEGCPWSVPVTSEDIAAARRGKGRLYLTPTKPVPRDWVGDVRGKDVLCLAAGGGQQGPIVAAAGANVTVLDYCPAQLEIDREVMQREGLDYRLVDGSMDDLSMFADEAFDLIVHPVSNCYVPDVHPVWRECHRVLRPGGVLLAAFCNPVMYIFDPMKIAEGELVVRYSLPSSDAETLDPKDREWMIAEKEAFQFGHLLQDQIGGQIAAGFVITGFFEDYMPDAPWAEYLPSKIATRGVKAANGPSGT